LAPTFLALSVLVAAAALAADPQPPPVAAKCVSDLAKRLHIKATDVKVADFRQVTWPDAALGLPDPDRAYAQVLSPGWGLILAAANSRYLYTAGEHAFRYGGPVDLWKYSALYTIAATDDADINGDLIQVSLAGTNPTFVLEGVSAFRAQVDGSILATRRTSRSGFDLLYIAPGQTGSAATLGAAFDFGDAVVGPDGKEWIAFRRATVGGDWQLARNGIQSPADQTQLLDLPAKARPSRLFWENGRIIAQLRDGDATLSFELVKNGDAWEWETLDAYVPDEVHDLMLNKSETLDVVPCTVDGKPSTRVVKKWFMGDEKEVATIVGFQHRGVSITPDQHFVLVWGIENEKLRAYTVDLSTGEVLPSVAHTWGKPALFRAQPHASPELQSVLGGTASP
jgi:hypothetical protein